MKKNYDILSWERILLLFLVMFLPIPVLAQEINIRPKESGNSKIEKTENKEEIKKDNKAIDEKKQKNYYDYSFQSSLDFVLNNDISRNSNTPNRGRFGIRVKSSHIYPKTSTSQDYRFLTL